MHCVWNDACLRAWFLLSLVPPKVINDMQERGQAEATKVASGKGFFPVPNEWTTDDPSVNPFHRRPLLYLILMIHFCRSANFRDSDTCRRGECVFGYRKLASQYRVNINAVQRAVDFLRRNGKISTQTSTHGTVVTIIKYDEFFVLKEDTSTQTSTKPVQDQYKTSTSSIRKTIKGKTHLSGPRPERVTSWEATEPLAKVFENLQASSRYAEVFDLERDRTHLSEIQKRYDLSLNELEQITWELKLWSESPKGEKMKSPRGTLATFAKNFVAKRPEPVKQPSQIKLDLSSGEGHAFTD